MLGSQTVLCSNQSSLSLQDCGLHAPHTEGHPNLPAAWHSLLSFRHRRLPRIGRPRVQAPPLVTIRDTGEEKGGRTERILEELMAKTSSILAKDLNLYIQKTEQIPNRINPKKFIPRHNIIEIMKTKNKEISSKQKERNGTLTWMCQITAFFNNTLTDDLNHNDSNRQTNLLRT